MADAEMPKRIWDLKDLLTALTLGVGGQFEHDDRRTKGRLRETVFTDSFDQFPIRSRSELADRGALLGRNGSRCFRESTAVRGFSGIAGV